MIQMNTSVVPPSRLASFIDCPLCDSVALGESYYTLIDLINERYQFTVPVSWSVDSVDTIQQYRCAIRFGGLSDEGSGMYVTSQQTKVTIAGT